MCEVWLRRIHAEFIEMLVERGSLELWKVERNGWRIVGILSQQVMSAQMVLGEFDQLRGRRRGILCEDLREDVTAELLDPYFIEPRFGFF